MLSVDFFVTLALLVMLQAVLGFDNLLYISLESKRVPAVADWQWYDYDPLDSQPLERPKVEIVGGGKVWTAVIGSRRSNGSLLLRADVFDAIDEAGLTGYD